MKTPELSFDARAYWQRRIRGDGSLSNVGQKDLGPYNRFTYPRRIVAFDRALAGLAPAAPRVFDGGFGEGVYLRYWANRGARSVAGVDFSPRAVEAGRRDYPTFDLQAGDLSAPEDLYKFGRYDIVTAVDVLYNIVDDDAWRAAVNNLLHLVTPGGLFLFSDKFPRQGTYRPAAHVRRRSFAMWEELLAANQCTVVRRVPVFLLMDDPIRCGDQRVLGWLAQIQWLVVSKLIRVTAPKPGLQRAVATGLANLQLPLERSLLRRMKRVPNLELVVCRKAA